MIYSFQLKLQSSNVSPFLVFPFLDFDNQSIDKLQWELVFQSCWFWNASTFKESFSVLDDKLPLLFIVGKVFLENVPGEESQVSWLSAWIIGEFNQIEGRLHRCIIDAIAFDTCSKDWPWWIAPRAIRRLAHDHAREGWLNFLRSWLLLLNNRSNDRLFDLFLSNDFYRWAFDLFNLVLNLLLVYLFCVNFCIGVNFFFGINYFFSISFFSIRYLIDIFTRDSI